MAIKGVDSQSQTLPCLPNPEIQGVFVRAVSGSDSCGYIPYFIWWTFWVHTLDSVTSGSFSKNP